MILTCNVLFKLKSHFLSVISFNNIRKRVWDLMFSCKYSANQTSTCNLNRINCINLDFVKALLYKWMDVKLKIHPHSFHYHATRNSSMKRHPVNIVFAVSIISRRIKNNSVSLFISVWKQYFKVKRLFVNYFALKHDVRLYET